MRGGEKYFTGCVFRTGGHGRFFSFPPLPHDQKRRFSGGFGGRGLVMKSIFTQSVSNFLELPHNFNCAHFTPVCLA
jgi:hypothetical protein